MQTGTNDVLGRHKKESLRDASNKRFAAIVFERAADQGGRQQTGFIHSGPLQPR